jgi:hypothetical protein
VVVGTAKVLDSIEGVGEGSVPLASVYCSGVEMVEAILEWSTLQHRKANDEDSIFGHVGTRKAPLENQCRLCTWTGR